MMPVFGERWYNFGNKTWAMRARDLARLRRAESMMAPRMCEVSLKDRKRGESLRHLMCREQDPENKVEMVWAC